MSKEQSGKDCCSLMQRPSTGEHVDHQENQKKVWVALGRAEPQRKGGSGSEAGELGRNKTTQELVATNKHFSLSLENSRKPLGCSSE